MTVSALRYAGQEFVKTVKLFERDEAEKEAGAPGLPALLTTSVVTMGLVAALALPGCNPRDTSSTHRHDALLGSSVLAASPTDGYSLTKEGCTTATVRSDFVGKVDNYCR